MSEAQLLADEAIDKYGDPSKAHAYLMGMFDGLFQLDKDFASNETAGRRSIILDAAGLVENRTVSGLNLR